MNINFYPNISYAYVNVTDPNFIRFSEPRNIFLGAFDEKMLSKDLGILSGVLRNSMIIFLHERHGPGSHWEEEVIGLLMDSML